MTISQPTSILYEIEQGLPVPAGKRAYFAARLRNRLYNFVMTKFKEQERLNSLTKAELARKTGHRPEVITRMLASPGNWRLDTVSDLLLGISGEELGFTATSPLTSAKRNYGGHDWLAADIRMIEKAPEQKSEFSFNPLLRRKKSTGLDALVGASMEG